MNYKCVFYIIFFFVLLLFSALFSCTDMVYASVSTRRLKLDQKSKTAQRALKLALNYDNTITTILLCNNLVNILASTLGTLLAIELGNNNSMGMDSSLWALIIQIIVLFLLLLFGEILPKAIGRSYSYRLSLLLCYPVIFFQTIFFPLVWPSRKLATLMVKPLYKKKAAHGEEYVPSDEELVAMVEEIEDEGIFDEDEAEFVTKSIEFSEISCHEIMTPRMKIEAFADNTDLNKLFAYGSSFNHSRIIVYHKNYDKIVGYVSVKAILRAKLSTNYLRLSDFLLQPIYVPRTMEISTLLKKMRSSKRHLAIVKDEFGGTEGLITMEDILEELVGEMRDEEDDSIPEIRQGSKKNEFIVLGSMPIDDFFERFNLDKENIDEDDYSTLSGWINDHVVGFAKKGDRFKYGKVDVKVTKTTEYTVEEALIVYHPRRHSVPEK